MNFNHFVCHTCTMGEKAVMEANSNYWVFLICLAVFLLYVSFS